MFFSKSFTAFYSIGLNKLGNMQRLLHGMMRQTESAVTPSFGMRSSPGVSNSMAVAPRLYKGRGEYKRYSNSGRGDLAIFWPSQISTCMVIPHQKQFRATSCYRGGVGRCEYYRIKV